MTRLLLITLLSSALIAHAAGAETIVQAASSRVETLRSESSHQVAFSLMAMDAATSEKFTAVVRGSLAHNDVVAVIEAVPLVSHVSAIRGPWHLHIVGDHQFAQVTVKPLPSCKGKLATGKDWLLAFINGAWSIVAEPPSLHTLCHPEAPPLTSTLGAP